MSIGYNQINICLYHIEIIRHIQADINEPSVANRENTDRLFYIHTANLSNFGVILSPLFVHEKKMKRTQKYTLGTSLRSI